MDRKPHRNDSPGPFKTSQLREGDRYELSRGHAIYCAPTGADGARGTAIGAMVLDTDPAVDSSGIDAGFELGEGTLRAPDIAVGGVPDRRGWIKGAPPLAVEYAGSGQDEAELALKIEELLQHGTRFVWVVRMLPPRRVEVYEAGQAMRRFDPGQELLAPGILQNPVPVEALFDRDVAQRLALRNLLQREGYQDLDAVLTEGREEGREEGRNEGREEGREEGRADATRGALLAVLGSRQITIGADDRARIESCLDLARLRRWLERAATATQAAAVFNDD